MKTFLFLLLAASFTFPLFGQSGATAHQVIILGNLADVNQPDVFLINLENRLRNIEAPFIVLLNGDLASNFPPDDKNRLALVKKLMDLVETFPSGNLMIAAGDRDWNESRRSGQKYVLETEAEIKLYLKEKGYKKTKWITPDGCPGPFISEIDESLVLIGINTQWWNHPFDKPRPSDGICNIITHSDFMEELEDAVDEFRDRNILIFGHHPFRSLGNYGGRFSFGNHLDPFPLAGSFRLAFRKSIGTRLDISNENLEPFVEGMKNLFFFNKNLIYASGHEHNHQIILDNDNFIINSGAIQKGKYVAKDPDTWFSGKTPGWLELSYKKNGAVEAFFIPQDQEKEKNRLIVLFDSGCSSASQGANPRTPPNLAYTPCLENQTLPDAMSRKYPELEEVVAGKEYEAGKWKQFWWGKHYRSDWTAPVNTPYLNLDTTFGGLRVYKKGGGRQTVSLKFRSADKTEYVFRSVNKDPSKAFNYKLRPTLVATITKDQTSTQHPYGAMAVDPLLNKLGILHAHPVLFILPNDEKLGHFQYQYGNLLGMLEENPGKKNASGKRFGSADDIMRSNKFFKNLYQDHNNKIATDEFVRARVFDILVGDWSKHEDNWKWAKFSTGNGNIFRPIPRDRDHVFSKQDGFWPYFADREWALQNIENFDYKIKGLKSLMWQARHMDRFVASEATREQWLQQAQFIQASITEADIDAAVRNMPAETYDISGNIISKKLKQRLKDLPDYAAKYYTLLAKEVDVVGSAKKEYFDIERADDGTVTVSMFDVNDEGQKGENLLYQRKFLPKETREVRVYGLGGKDVFNITGSGSDHIKVRLFGGPGDDTFLESGNRKAAKTLIYDKGKSTETQLGKGAKIVNHWNKEIYEYDRTRFKYNNYKPLVYLDYNNFNGLALGGGVTFTRQRYHAEDYSSKHNLAAEVSTETNLKFVYEGRFHQVIKKWDILLNASAASPEFHNNFFGLGNTTLRTRELKRADFYEIKYSQYSILTGIAREFWKQSEFNILFGFESVNSKNLEQPTILDESPELLGLYQTINYIPARIDLDLDFRDERGFPYSGTRLLLNYFNGTFLNQPAIDNNIFSFGYLEGALEYYISTINKKLTLGLRFGGAKGYGDLPFYKMPNLGGTNGLRGFTGQRFTGESKAFFNSELRWQLFERYTPLFPVKFGLKAFFDTGRVYYSKDEMDTNFWHTGYGGGIFLVPFSEAFVISVSLGFSDEESFYPIIGIGTPLR